MTETTTELALWQKVVALYAAEDPLQIAHTQAVVDYTGRIAELEGLSERRIFLLKTAALLHDIGCPAARAAYGDSKPPHQEKEGERIVRELLPEFPEFSADEADYLAKVVGSHHHIGPMKELHAEPLFEADLIVNLLEGYYERSRAAFYRDKMISTASGRRVFNTVFGLR